MPGGDVAMVLGRPSAGALLGYLRDTLLVGIVPTV